MRTWQHIIILGLALMAVVAGIGPAHAAGDWNAVQSGQWHDPATWDQGSVPPSPEADNVRISSGITVTVAPGSAAYVLGPGVLTVAGTLINHGELHLTSLLKNGLIEPTGAGNAMLTYRIFRNTGTITGEGLF